MGILTLTTDLGYRDPYLAIVKAKLLASGASYPIIDLSCDIKDNAISDTAFILKNALPHFPDESIHLVAIKFIVDRSNLNKSSSVDNSRFLVTRYKNQFILCPDTGLFTLLDSEFKEPVYQLYYEGENRHHFFLKDIFVDAALHLMQKKRMEDIAALTNDYYKAYQFESFVNGNILRGKGIYVDNFGNIVTNITRERFGEVIGKRSFQITLPGTRITKIHDTYDEVKYGAPLVLFNSFGYLEIAVNGKSAFHMLCPRDIGTGFDFNILIEFYD
jgi:S-adenosylmethionine hydrolase